jgi:uncharacterized membrane protein YhiD involved in acid resistance
VQSCVGARLRSERLPELIQATRLDSCSESTEPVLWYKTTLDSEAYLMNPIHWLSTEENGQTLAQLGELTLALVLSSLIGLEREIRIMKSAGLRTHTLVGVAAALLMLVSKYGFGNVIVPYQIVLDPSRVAAQIVTGIGFIGGGLIFVQRDIVRGLTTAAGIWLTAAVGMACGAGLPVLALFVTGTYFLVMFGFSRLSGRIIHMEECETVEP